MAPLYNLLLSNCYFLTARLHTDGCLLSIMDKIDLSMAFNADNVTDSRKAGEDKQKDTADALNKHNQSQIHEDLETEFHSLTTDEQLKNFSLKPKVEERIQTLKAIQAEHKDLESKFLEEKTALEAKYQAMYHPLYTKRYHVVNGIIDAGITAASEADDSKGGVPNFWLTAMKNNKVLAAEINEDDENALKFLEDIKYFITEDAKGFKLEFHFGTNPCFKNTVLTKTYQVVSEDGAVKTKTGTRILWKPGKHMNKQCKSFFNFFRSGPSRVVGEDGNSKDENYAIGATIRDQIIPHATAWYTGEATAEPQDDTHE